MFRTQRWIPGAGPGMTYAYPSSAARRRLAIIDTRSR